MTKRVFGRNLGSLVVAPIAALAITLTPALSRPSAAGTPDGRWPQQAPPPGQQQWPRQTSPQSSSQGPLPWAQGWGAPTVEIMLVDLEHLYPQDVAIAEWDGGPILLWRGEPVTLVDVREVLDDDQIYDLLDGLDNDPLANDSAVGVTDLLQQAGILPYSVDVVGADLLDGPPVLFVLPE